MDIIKVMTKEQLDEAFQIRKTVFIDEQNVPANLEMDEHDETAIHFVGYDENQKPIAASRLRFIDDYGKLERICVLKEHRGKQFGKSIILQMEEYIKQHGYQKSKLNAQSYAETFYKKLGYKTISDEFMDAGIPHVTMIKQLS
ncbi:GNAT family N-acetyltransferase [Bacillaceae bacterium W0354]